MKLLRLLFLHIYAQVLTTQRCLYQPRQFYKFPQKCYLQVLTLMIQWKYELQIGFSLPNFKPLIPNLLLEDLSSISMSFLNCGKQTVSKATSTFWSSPKSTYTPGQTDHMSILPEVSSVWYCQVWLLYLFFISLYMMKCKGYVKPLLG